MRVCRHCGQVAPDPANEPICPGPDGLVTSHSYIDVKRVKLTYDWFRDEMLKALPGIEPSPKVEAQIRDLWDLAHEAGRRASEVHSDEEQCVICGESRGPDGFEDGLRCKLCAEKEEEGAPARTPSMPPTPETEDPTR